MKFQAVEENMTFSGIIRTHLVIILLVLSIGLLFNTPVEAATEAPDFTLDDLYGRQVSLKDYRGKIVVLDFWATWCMYCRMAAPELVKIQRNYRDKGLVILAISLDDRKECDNQCLREYHKRQKLNFKILRGDLKILVSYFGTPGIGVPTSVIVDEKGKIAGLQQGYVPGLLEKEIKRLLQ